MIKTYQDFSKSPPTIIIFRTGKKGESLTLKEKSKEKNGKVPEISVWSRWHTAVKHSALTLLPLSKPRLRAHWFPTPVHWIWRMVLSFCRWAGKIQLQQQLREETFVPERIMYKGNHTTVHWNQLAITAQRTQFMVFFISPGL